jgi:Heavy metal associated domain 2
MSALRVAHDVPGRLRLRLPVGVSVEGLIDAVGAQPGVQACTWSPRTRSLLVVYQPASATTADILETVAHHTSLAVAFNGESPQASKPAEAEEALARGVRDAARDLDHRVRRVTRGVVGLGGLVPTLLVFWAVGEVVRGRVRPLAWTSALWYAYGLFRDYAVERAQD